VQSPAGAGRALAAVGEVFSGLAEGGTVTLPIGPSFGSPCFGMVAGRFGLHGMVTVPETDA